jgi:hypothetical protein
MHDGEDDWGGASCKAIEHSINQHRDGAGCQGLGGPANPWQLPANFTKNQFHPISPPGQRLPARSLVCFYFVLDTTMLTACIIYRCGAEKDFPARSFEQEARKGDFS